MSYFLSKIDTKSKELSKSVPFSIGDILGYHFVIRVIATFLKVSYIYKKKKNYKSRKYINIRNILGTVGIEVSFSYFIIEFFLCV